MESDKGEAELRTSESGVITEFKYEIGDDAEVGDIMFVVDTEAEKPEGGSAPEETKSEEPAKEDAPAKSEPAKEAPKKESKPQKTSAPKQSTSSEAGDDSFVAPVFERTETKEKMSRMRKTIAKRLKDSQNTYASITTFNEVSSTFYPCYKMLTLLD